MHGYTEEIQVQILIALLKEKNIRRIIVSPGSTNVTFVASVQNDTFFTVYSCIDERSAAYMACGMAQESSEPVCLSCTGATASRNYYPALTEAFYRKLPIIAITSSQYNSRIGQLVPQVTDRSCPPKDVVNYSVTLPVVSDRRTYWECEVKVNSALNELQRNGGGPVHINVQTEYKRNYDVYKLPKVRNIELFSRVSEIPSINEKQRVCVFVGSHKKMKRELKDSIEKFAELYNAPIFCDHTSGYYGKNKIMYALVTAQKNVKYFTPDITILIGEVSGDYYSLSNRGRYVWRISEDGIIRDGMARTKYVIQTDEFSFFEEMNGRGHHKCIDYYGECKRQDLILRKKLEETKLPFSNIWIASRLSKCLPKNSCIHFGILNSLRAWNFFYIDNSIDSCCNVGGFGIDGCMSSLIGASLVNSNRLYYLVIGDLAFFYDLNVLGNRHIGNNIRIILINNGCGAEFKTKEGSEYQFGDDVDAFIAASGHNTHKDIDLVKKYSESLGFEYSRINDKKDFESIKGNMIDTRLDKPHLYEILTDSRDDSLALDIIKQINKECKL